MSAGFKIQLSHGYEKHEIYIESENCTVKEFATKIEDETGVPIVNQKLIFKGKSLSDAEEKLSFLGIVNNSKVMLLGRKFNERDEGFIRSMKEVEKKLTKVEVNLADVNKQYTETKNEFLPSNLQSEAVEQMKGKLVDLVEDFTKLLLSLDSLEVIDSSNEVRTKRKTLVQKILKSLEKADDLQDCLNNHKDCLNNHK